MNPHANQEPAVDAGAEWEDGSHPAGEFRPQADAHTGRRAAILAGIMIGAVAVGTQISPAMGNGFTTFPSVP